VRFSGWVLSFATCTVYDAIKNCKVHTGGTKNVWQCHNGDNQNGIKP